MMPDMVARCDVISGSNDVLSLMVERFDFTRLTWFKDVTS
jgi:hypothetical protein